MAESESPVTSINIAALTGLSRAINNTYNYANNSYFGALIPHFYRDYYFKYVQVACGWLDGYVYTLHSESGIIATRIGSALINGLTKQIVGEQLVFKKASKEKDYDTLNFITKWAKDHNLIKAVFAGVGYAEAIGTSMIKINKRMDGDLWCEAIRFDNCCYLTDFAGEIEEATFFMRNYVDTRNGKDEQFVLCERRWYEYEEKGKITKTPDGFKPVAKKGAKTAMVQYCVHRCEGTTYNNMQVADGNGTSLNWDEIPSKIRKAIKRDYGTLKVGEPQKLGFRNLGVFALLNGEVDLSIPTVSTFGKSMLVDVQDDLITYEIATSYLIRDMYLGKGTVYLPKDLSISDYDGTMKPDVMSGIGDTKMELLKGVSPEQQKIVVEQFQLRAAEWQTIKENALKNIAVKWGMSPKILASFLAQGQAQQTATQIDSEDDMSIAFISHTRAYFKHPLNQLIETVLNYYGKENDVEIDFASPSLINKDRILDRTIKELENGLIDIEEALRILNPDMDEEALQAKIDKAKQNRQMLMLQQQTEMNPEGGFGNDYMDLGGANLNGSTMPEQ